MAQRNVVNFLDKKAGTSSLNLTIDLGSKRSRNERQNKTQSVDSRVMDAKCLRCESRRALDGKSSIKSMYYSVYDQKFERIKQYNADAKQVLQGHKRQYNKQLRAKLDDIVRRDQELMKCIPHDLCNSHL